MGRESKRICAPTLVEVPSPPATQPDMPLLPLQPTIPSSFASTYGPGAWIPALTPQSMVPSSAPCWLTKLQQPSVVGSSTQGSWLFSARIGASAYVVPTTENVEHPNHALDARLQVYAWTLLSANEGHKEMLETQRRVSSENLEARKLKKERKESNTLNTYRSLMMQDTTGMPEDVRSEHMLALRCLREKLFDNMTKVLSC
uniref:No apical meristem-associated C-terminal domain-containing protein n=1 Tax=Oryza punctata TaxID=4537 RepID=A0A0E0JYN4_ORYPU